jgi:hypothetical protein
MLDLAEYGMPWVVILRAKVGNIVEGENISQFLTRMQSSESLFSQVHISEQTSRSQRQRDSACLIPRSGT